MKKFCMLKSDRVAAFNNSGFLFPDISHPRPDLLSLSLLLPRSPRPCLVARGRSIWSQFPLPSVSRLTALSLFRLETKFDAWPDRTGEI